MALCFLKREIKFTGSIEGKEANNTGSPGESEKFLMLRSEWSGSVFNKCTVTTAMFDVDGKFEYIFNLKVWFFTHECFPVLKISEV